MAAGKVVVYADGKLTKTSSGEDATIDGNLVVTQNLTVNGTTTTINSTTLQVDDKNIELGTVDTPTDNTADGGGITLKGDTDHTILWTNSTDSWDFSEHVNLASGKQFKINGSQISSSDLSDGADLQQQPEEGPFENGDKSKLDGIEDGADVTDADNVAAAGAVMESDDSTASMSFVVDEDDMVSDSDTKVPTQQSVKAYVDGAITGSTLTGGSNISINSGSIDLDSSVNLGNGSDLSADQVFVNQFLAASVQVVIADLSQTIGVGKAVCLSGNGTVQLSDNTDTDKDMVVGITIDDGAAGRTEYTVANDGFGNGNGVPVAVAGSIVTATITGTQAVGAEVYLSTGGGLNMSPPTTGAIIRVGYCWDTSTNKILIQPQFIMDN